MSGRKRAVGTRPRLKEIEKRRVWVRSGGRCAICNRDLIDGELTAEPVSLGELAHIVGQKETAGSPRGLAIYPAAERDLADNILLACGDCHAEIDNPATLTLFTVAKLGRTKREHEERIKHVTGLRGDQRTVVLRMIGSLRGRPLELAQRTAVEAVLGCTNRYPYFKLTYDRLGIEIDLRAIPGEFPVDDCRHVREPAPTQRYYDSAKAAIDDIVDGVLRDGLARGLVDHVSVFAFARLPLLVYLGKKLGDGYSVDLYQRHRSRDSWLWSDENQSVSFEFSGPHRSDVPEAVLLASISGTVHEREIPAHLRELPIFRIDVADGCAIGGMMESKATFTQFQATLRGFFGDLERRHKNITRMHLFGALPISAAIAIGRVQDPVIQPAIVTYDRVDGGAYELAFEVQ